MPPTQSYGRENDSPQNGLNPLFLMAFVFLLTTLAGVAPLTCCPRAGVHRALTCLVKDSATLRASMVGKLLGGDDPALSRNVSSDEQVGSYGLPAVPEV